MQPVAEQIRQIAVGESVRIVSSPYDSVKVGTITVVADVRLIRLRNKRVSRLYVLAGLKNSHFWRNEIDPVTA